jgi:hypothetical protein
MATNLEGSTGMFAGQGWIPASDVCEEVGRSLEFLSIALIWLYMEAIYIKKKKALKIQGDRREPDVF